jgi:hypothetical protein
LEESCGGINPRYTLMDSLGAVEAALRRHRRSGPRLERKWRGKPAATGDYSICGERKTHERIAHILKTGKPLRN